MRPVRARVAGWQPSGRKADAAALSQALEILRQTIVPALAEGKCQSLGAVPRPAGDGQRPPPGPPPLDDHPTASPCPGIEPGAVCRGAASPKGAAPGDGWLACAYRFTEEKVFLDMLADGIELLESERLYDESILMLRLLLDFPLYRSAPAPYLAFHGPLTVSASRCCPLLPADCCLRWCCGGWVPWCCGRRLGRARVGGGRRLGRARVGGGRRLGRARVGGGRRLGRARAGGGRRLGRSAAVAT